MLKSGSDISARYERITPVCRLLWRPFKLLAYVAAGAAALLCVIAAVLVFVNVSAEELLFTPYMKLVTEDGVKKFDVCLGNGIEVLRAYDAVDLNSIKCAVYAGIFTLAAALTVCVPVFTNLGKLFKSIGNGCVLAPENAAYVNYIGLSVMIGNPAVLLIKRYFNYRLIKAFVDGDLRFDFGIDLFGVFLGLLLIIFGTIYGQACTAHKRETALVRHEAND